MIIDRRQTHFYSFIILACIVPIIFLVGVISPPDYPLNDTFSHNYPNIDKTKLYLDKNSIFTSGDITVAYEVENDQGNNLLILEPISYLEIGEPLLYWQSTSEAPESITEKSILLGEIKGQNRQFYTLPEEVKNSQGYLIIYSQIFQEIKASFAIDLSKK